MAEITWRNINAPDFTPVARLQESGANLINLGINGINNTLDTYRNNQIANFDARKERNTGNAINQLVSLGSLGDYDAAVQSGQFSPKQLQERFGAAVDTNAIAKQLSVRRGDLIRDESGELSLAQAQREQAAQPLRDEILKYVAAGDIQSAVNAYNANSDKLTGSVDLASAIRNLDNQKMQFALDNQRLALARAAANKKNTPSASAMKSASIDAYKQYLMEDYRRRTEAKEDPKNFNGDHLKVAVQFGLDAKTANTAIKDVDTFYNDALAVPAQAYDQTIKPIEGMIKDAKTTKENKFKTDLNTLGLSSAAYEAVNLGGENSVIKTEGDLINSLYDSKIFDNNKGEIRSAVVLAKKINPGLSLDGIDIIIRNSTKQGGFYFGNDVIEIDEDLVEKQAKQAKDMQSNPATMNQIKEFKNANDLEFDATIGELEDAKRKATLEIRSSMLTGKSMQPVIVPIPDYSTHRQNKKSEDNIINENTISREKQVENAYRAMIRK